MIMACQNFPALPPAAPPASRVSRWVSPGVPPGRSVAAHWAAATVT